MNDLLHILLTAFDHTSEPPSLGLPIDTRFIDEFDYERSRMLFEGLPWHYVFLPEELDFAGPYYLLSDRAKLYYLPAVALHAVIDFDSVGFFCQILLSRIPLDEWREKGLLEYLNSEQLFALKSVLLYVRKSHALMLEESSFSTDVLLCISHLKATIAGNTSAQV